MKQLISGIAILFLIQGSLYAHPHVFIKTGIVVCFNETGINKLKVKFEFDRVFSNELKQGFDKNKNGRFDPNEIATIKAKAFSNLVKFNYFIHVVYNNKKVKHTNISDFSASLNNGVVSYTFTINTKLLIGPDLKTIKIAPYDHSYYIDVMLRKENIKFENTGSFDYNHKLIDDRSMAYYYKQIYPKCIVLTAKRL